MFDDPLCPSHVLERLVNQPIQRRPEEHTHKHRRCRYSERGLQEGVILLANHQSDIIGIEIKPTTDPEYERLAVHEPSDKTLDELMLFQLLTRANHAHLFDTSDINPIFMKSITDIDDSSTDEHIERSDVEHALEPAEFWVSNDKCEHRDIGKDSSSYGDDPFGHQEFCRLASSNSNGDKRTISIQRAIPPVTELFWKCYRGLR